MLTLTCRRPMLCLTGVLLAAQVSACSSWHVQGVSPGHLTVGDSTQLRITRLNGLQVTVRKARVIGDTLFGTPTRIDRRMPDTLVAIPLSDIRVIALRQEDAWKTIGLALGITTLLAGGIFLLFVLPGLGD